MSLSVKNLSFSYGKHKVLNDVSFETQSGEMLALLGPNGAGKSTLFRCILGLLSTYVGHITLEGESLKAMPPQKVAAKIAYIPQAHHPVFQYTVMDMVLMGTANRVGAFHTPGKKERLQALEAMRLMGIEVLAAKSYLHLSGGEQQLVLIARALAQQAKVLLMDEPTSSLDYGNQQRVLESVKALGSNGYTVLMSTHNPQHALYFASSILALDAGSVAAAGAPGETLDEALLKRLYGVEAHFIDTPNGRVIYPVAKGGES